MGPTASSELSQRIYGLSSTPPGVRMAGFREVAVALRCEGQVGSPPSVATDAQSGYSFMAYQSAELLFGRREGSGLILVRTEGTCARGHTAGENAAVTQRATVG